MKLKELLKKIKYKKIIGPQDIEITDICSDSRMISSNNLFIARKGKRFDGARFIDEAVALGARAVLTDTYDPKLKNATQIIADDVSRAEADIAAFFYNFPSNKLKLIGITGTNGKTTTNYLIKHILDSVKKDCGLISTIECIFRKNKILSKLTTPDNVTLQKYLRKMADDKLKNCCIEASSHALDQNRLKNVDFDIGIFTNLSHDHLDYHKTFDNYKRAKKKLFDTLSENNFAIVNIDDENASFMIKDTKAKIISYSTQKKADFLAKNIKCSAYGTSFILYYKNKKIRFFSNLIGRHNVYNLLAAIAASVVSYKINIQDLAQIIYSFEKILGRLEKVQNSKKINIYVDFAHSPDALKNVLMTMSHIKKKRIINVFGSGGDRDTGKRPQMAQISEQFSDISIITSDNPRSENPLKIINEIKKGFSKNANYIVEKNRKKAIEKAIKLAKEDDIIIITGKGHETYQILKNKTICFDDREISKIICDSM